MTGNLPDDPRGDDRGEDSTCTDVDVLRKDSNILYFADSQISGVSPP